MALAVSAGFLGRIGGIGQGSDFRHDRYKEDLLVLYRRRKTRPLEQGVLTNDASVEVFVQQSPL